MTGPLNVRVRVVDQGTPRETAQAFCGCGWVQIPRRCWDLDVSSSPTMRAEDDACAHARATRHLLPESGWVIDCLRSQIAAATSAEALRARGPKSVQR